MSDIVERLRRWTHAVDAQPACDLMDEAANELERLRWRVKTLESAAKHAARAKRKPNLTPRMRDLVKAVATLTEQRGYPPSLVEVADRMGVHTSRAHFLARAAEACGAIARTPGASRSIRVAKKLAATQEEIP